MPANLGAAEILVILVVALIVLGPKRLPEAGRQVGKALAEMRRWSRGIQSEIKDAFDVVEEPPMVSTDQVTAEAARVEAARPEAATAAPSSSETTSPAPTEPVVPSAAPTSPERPQEVVEPPVQHNGSAPPDEATRQ
ncbi:MAG: twin-arginine translocase TatA/TatE family subunit [Actinomycetota bacterium]|nr:twin-arginine translocase TatA/TatE family subunit [Actinomycetota bacterium]